MPTCESKRGHVCGNSSLGLVKEGCVEAWGQGPVPTGW